MALLAELVCICKVPKNVFKDEDPPEFPEEDAMTGVPGQNKTVVEKELEVNLVGEEGEMEICDPCYCYTKCWMDTVASLFCVSLL